MENKKNIFIIAIILLIIIIGGLFIYNYFNKSKLYELNVDKVIEKFNHK